ncbi:dihydrofolate reductase family protein [Cryptosporangium sp. NPDC048952]|uniref:dihydrofolate reductase family protein n=1 Tax=Cryptosporangium sp. NPDC048952 TaxID=3363961 RepID=UPI003716C36E
MRSLVVTENITLDGVIEMTGDWFDPTAPDSDDINEATREHMLGADAFLVGRTTFEDMRSFWPKQNDDTTGVTDYLNQVQKYVVSRSLTDPEWEPTTILRGPLRDDVAALKAAPGKDIVVTGSVDLVRQLVAKDLVDEYRLFVYPTVVGRGARLFPDGVERPQLRLLESRAFRSGVVLLCYSATQQSHQSHE